jgi:lactoylglutathione lyase
MIRKIATAAVYVSDQRDAVEFWTRKVGFEIHREEADGNWVEVGPSGAESCLVIYPKSLSEDWPERKPSIVFECDNIHKTFGEMRDRGVHFSQEPKAMQWSTFAIFLDTEDNLHGLRELPA